MCSYRLQAHKLDARQVTDIAERVLYNSSVTTGMSVDGKAFTYDNLLASLPGHACERHTWFECACCPPNVLRTMAVIAGYFWAPLQQGGLVLHHPFDGSIQHNNIQLQIKTDYPWDGKMETTVKGATRKEPVRIRIPNWSKTWTASWLKASENATSLDFCLASDGYITIPHHDGRYDIDLDIRPRLIYSHPYTGRDTVTVAYGPLIY